MTKYFWPVVLLAGPSLSSPRARAAEDAKAVKQDDAKRSVIGAGHCIEQDFHRIEEENCHATNAQCVARKVVDHHEELENKVSDRAQKFEDRQREQAK